MLRHTPLPLFAIFRHAFARCRADTCHTPICHDDEIDVIFAIDIAKYGAFIMLLIMPLRLRRYALSIIICRHDMPWRL